VKIAVFVSGRGSNLQAIIESQPYPDKVGINFPENFIEVKAICSDKLECKAFEIAKKFSIPTFSVGNKPGYIQYDELVGYFVKNQIDLIVLAGFLKMIPVNFLRKFESKIINIHPALLPSFGGKGMFGMNVHKAVFDSSAKVSGATIHFVEETYDTGKIIAQKCVDITTAKSPEEIASMVLDIEHEILPYVIKKFAEDKIKRIDNRVIILN
jgi:phosphoribosylglycinamide formyltransferase 1